MKINDKSEYLFKYEQIVAEALLSLGTVDTTDLNIIVREIEEIGMGKVELHHGRDLPNLFPYVVKEKDGTITLINGKEKSVSDYLLKQRGVILDSYFDQIDANFFKRKREFIEKGREKLLLSANVLLISEDKADYDALVSYGFKNIDFFKSLVCADRYFKDHPKVLGKYHLTLIGRQSIKNCTFFNSVELEDKLKQLSNNWGLVVADFYRYYHSNTFRCDLEDKRLNRRWLIEVDKFDELLDRIMESCIISDVLSLVDLNKAELYPIENYTAPIKIPVPKRKSDLKILFSGSYDKSTEDIIKSSGLNVTFIDDGNYALGQEIKTVLGDYDIVVASEGYSGALLTMGVESQEQGKCTGRRVSMLCTYDNKHLHWATDENGNLFIRSEEIVLSSLLVHQSDECFKTTESYFQMPVKGRTLPWHMYILSALINEYDERIRQLGFDGIEDNDLMSCQEITDLTGRIWEQELERQRLEKASIENFDRFISKVCEYINNRSNRTLYSNFDDIILTQSKNGVRIECTLEGRTICVLTFPKEHSDKNIRVFVLESLSSKGTLGAPVTLSYHTKMFEGMPGIPEKPDENQQKIIDALFNKVLDSIKTVEEAERKEKTTKKIDFRPKKNKRRPNN